MVIRLTSKMVWESSKGESMKGDRETEGIKEGKEK
jgi:hypothetical protein